MDIETRRRVCRLIAGVVVVDDDLDDAENAFLDALLARFSLTSDEREALFPIVDGDEAARELKTLAEDQREEVLGLLISAVAADRRYVAEEKAYLHKVGAAMGLPADEVDARVQRAIARA